MKILIKVLVILALAVGGLVVLASTRPDDFRVERSTQSSANPTQLFAQINDFHAWEAWSPWAKLDSSMETKYDGAKSGIGAGYAWSGNSKVGQGAMRIVDSTPESKVTIQLEFLKPFKASNRTTFTLTPHQNGIRISWTMEGKNHFMSKVMGLFMDMDKMIGSDFERGLSNLKAVAERSTATAMENAASAAR